MPNEILSIIVLVTSAFKLKSVEKQDQRPFQGMVIHTTSSCQYAERFYTLSEHLDYFRKKKKAKPQTKYQALHQDTLKYLF